MTKEQIKVGKKVWYYPILGGSKREEAVIKTDAEERYGTVVCFVDIRSSVVDIENLEERV